MKTQIYLIRHCESEGNICRRNHAQFDGIVTRKGVMQSESLANRFDDVEIDAIYSSDAYRSIVTATPLAKRKGLPIKLRRLLREYTIGNWEGTGIGDMARDQADMWNVWIKTPWAHNIPGADNFNTVAQRGVEIIRQMARENRGGTVAAITHSCTLTCTLTAIMEKPISHYPEINSGDNTAVTLVEVDENDRIQIKFISDISHLPAELRRSNYTGRSRETTFAYDTVDDSNIEAYLQAYSLWASRSNLSFSKNQAMADLSSRQSENRRFALLPVLMDKYCGFVMMGSRPDFPEDHGIIDKLALIDEITEPGMAAQVFGEGLDELRRQGKRYLVLRESKDDFIQFLLDRFLFEKMPNHPGYSRLCMTVPGIEGPIY